MVEPKRTSVIHQKAGANRPPPEIRPVTPITAFSDALERAGAAMSGLLIAPLQTAQDRVVLSGWEGDLPQYGLLAAVEGPNSRFGVLSADCNLVAALIEMQTVGRVSNTPVVERDATLTDANMCADFFDQVLECLEDEFATADLPNADDVAGYRFASRLANFRAVTMALADIPYRRFRAEFDLADGARRGVMSVLLPYESGDAASKLSAREPSSGPPAIVLETHAELHAVLHRMRMSLEDIASFTLGQKLVLPREALGKVMLEDMAGKKVIHCRLGRAQGQRALRVGSAKPPDLLGQSEGTSPSAPDQISGSQNNGEVSDNSVTDAVEESVNDTDHFVGHPAEKKPFTEGTPLS